MKIQLSEEARLTLSELETYVETINTTGAGKRFTKKILSRIKSALQTTGYSLCKHERLRLRNLKCFFINDWVIAFEADNQNIIIRAIIHGSLLG